MTLPKYDFYISALKNEYSFTRGKMLNAENGELVNALNYTDFLGILGYATEDFIGVESFVDITKGNFFYDSLPPGAPLHNYGSIIICYYDADKAFISTAQLSTVDSLPYRIYKSDKTKYFRVAWAVDLYDGATGKILDLNIQPFIRKYKLIIPHYKKLSIKYTRENGQMFFRKELSDDIRVYGSDYEFIKACSIEDKLSLLIQAKSKTGDSSDIFNGNFVKSDCEFDVCAKSVKIKCEASDSYTEILNRYEDTYDLLKITPAMSPVSAKKRGVLQVYIPGNDSVTCIINEANYYELEVNERVWEDDVLTGTYHFGALLTTNISFIYAGININFNEGASTHPSTLISNQGYILKRVLYAQKNSLISSYPIRTNTLLYDLANIENFYPTAQTVNWPYNIYKIQLLDSSNNVLITSDNMFYDSEDDTYFRFERPSATYLMNPNISGISAFTAYFVGGKTTYRVYQRLLTSAAEINGHATFDLPYDDICSERNNYKKCYPTQFGDVIENYEVSNEPTRWGLLETGGYFKEPSIDNSLHRFIPVCKNSWKDTSVWITNIEFFSENNSIYTNLVIKNTYSIQDAIKAILNKINPSIKHEGTSEYSQFLYGDAISLLSTLYGVPVNLYNYKLFIAPKSNVLKGNYDQPAQKAEITLKSIMDMLKNCFQCYWYLDGDKFKIEHISYFKHGLSYTDNNDNIIDVTALRDKFNKKSALYFQGQLSFDKDSTTRRYEFDWMDDSSEGFSGVTLDAISNSIAQDKTEDISISNFSSDIDYMLACPDNFSNDGFALLCALENDGIYKVPIQYMQLSDGVFNFNAALQNAGGSFAYLVRNYMFDASSLNMESNMSGDMKVFDIKNYMSHSISLPVVEGINEHSIIHTDIGDGIIDSMSVNIDTGLTEMTLTYKPW